MKHIITAIMMSVCCIFSAAFAQAPSVVTSTARIIRVDDIAQLPQSSMVNKVPQSCTGVLVSAEGHVFTADALVRAGDSSSGVEYLVLFPMYKGDNVYAVHAYMARSQAVSTDNNLLVLKINKENLPSYISVVDQTAKNSQDIINIGYPDAIAKAMTFEDRGRINAALREICVNVKLRGTAELVVTNENQDNAQLMQYVTPQMDKGHIIRTTSQQGTRTEIQHQTNIDRGSEGSPLLDAASHRVIGITTSVISGLNPYNNAQSSATIIAFAKTFNIKLAGGSLISNDSPWLYYAIGGAAILLVLLVSILVVVNKKNKNEVVQAPSSVGMSVNAQSPREVSETVVLPHVLFELLSENGEQYQVTSEMIQRGVRIGRGTSCELRFTHPTVSANHATLTAYAGRAAITDVGSTGGTKVNGKSLPLNQPHTLHRGDTLILGACRVNVR